MGQKDLSERRLFELNDVFADIVRAEYCERRGTGRYTG